MKARLMAWGLLLASALGLTGCRVVVQSGEADAVCEPSVGARGYARGVHCFQATLDATCYGYEPTTWRPLCQWPVDWEPDSETLPTPWATEELQPPGINAPGALDNSPALDNPSDGLPELDTPPDVGTPVTPPADVDPDDPTFGFPNLRPQSSPPEAEPNSTPPGVEPGPSSTETPGEATPRPSLDPDAEAPSNEPAIPGAFPPGDDSGTLRPLAPENSRVESSTRFYNPGLIHVPAPGETCRAFNIFDALPAEVQLIEDEQQRVAPVSYEAGSSERAEPPVAVKDQRHSAGDWIGT